MEFRWIIFLTLWTTLSGPMLVRPSLGNIQPVVVKRTPAEKPHGTCRARPVAYP